MTEHEEIQQRKLKWAQAAWDVNSAEELNSYTKKSIFEYREDTYGWRTFGDLKWGDGFCNLHYDIPYWLLKEFERSADQRCKQLARDMLFYKAHFGLVQGDEHQNEELNLKGGSFYEKGHDQGNYDIPKTSHHWNASFWRYYFISGEDWAYKAAKLSTGFMMQPWIINAYKGAQEVRHLSWPLWNFCKMYQYAIMEEDKAIAREWAYKYAAAILESEFIEGSRGWMYGRDIYGQPAEWQQPFMWFGYGGIGLVEFHKTFKEPEYLQLLKRMAKACEDTLQGGTMNGGAYRRITQSYFWHKDGGARTEEGAGELAMMCLPLLKYTMNKYAYPLERDQVFWRDTGRNDVDISERCIINPFNSPLFSGSMPKLWGQTMFSLFSV
jgi:hypothetical protein